jgi:DNA-binding SARP family transcriptional activator
MSIAALTSDDGTVNGQGGDLAFVRVLGPVQVVTTSQRSLDLPSASQRRLVALLATEAPRSLRTDWICDVLAVSPSALRTTVSRVRRTVGDGAIAGSQGRYRLAVPVDAALFTSALAQVSSRDDRIEALERALAMWTGPPFDEFSAEAWAGPEVVRLTELHASAVEDHAIELIAERRWAEAVAELQSHVAVHPLRDRPRGLLLQALAGAGRQADALGAFRDYGAYLAESVGTEPSAEVRRLDRRVASGWDGVEATAGNAGSSRRARRPAGWLPLTAELARGPRLIGRGRELARLASDLALVSGMGSRTVILEGEAGIGKTTLLGGFARAVRDSGSAAVLYGFCPGGPAVPSEPFRSLLEHLIEHAPADMLRAHASRCGGQLTRIAPRLADRVEIPGTVVSDDATERHLMFEAVADVLRRVADIGSVVVLLDDLQWAEPTGLDLLRHLGRALADAPVLWVLSARDTDERPLVALRTVLADLERRPSRRMLLRGFGDDELADLTASLVAADGAVVTSAVSARLREQTAGNPLYATQLVRHWAESGRLVLDARVEVADDESGEEVPANLRGLLWSRVMALGNDVLEVLSAAAVLGTEFAEDAVIDMVEIPERAVMDALDLAERARLVVDVGPQARTMRFVHALVAGAVYSELPGRRRRRLHARAAQVLEKRSGTPATDLAAQLARHYALGGLLAEALRWARLAGDHAAGRLSPAEAARWYRTALEHTAIVEVADHERAELLARLGRAQHQINDPAALATLTEAAALARSCGATQIVVQAALATDRGFLHLGSAPSAQVAIIESALEVTGEGDAATRARLLALLAEALPQNTPGTRRAALAREAIALADASPDPALLARIGSSTLFALWGPSDDAARLRADVARRSIAAAEATGDPHLEFAVHAAAYTVAIQLADPAAAARSLERLHAIADRIGAPRMIWTVSYYEAFVATMEARFADAEELMHQAADAAVDMGAADSFAVFAGQAAVLATIAGHHSELPPNVAQAIDAGPVQPTAALAHAIISVANGPKEIASDLLDAAKATGFRGVPPDVMWMTSMLGYAILAIELSDLDAAAQLLAIIEPYTGEIATNLGPVAAYAGRLASLLGHHDLAERHLSSALEIVEQFGWDYHRASVLIVLAGCRRRRLGGLDTQARAALDQAARICAAHNLSRLLATIDEMRQVRRG